MVAGIDADQTAVLSCAGDSWSRRGGRGDGQGRKSSCEIGNGIWLIETRRRSGVQVRVCLGRIVPLAGDPRSALELRRGDVGSHPVERRAGRNREVVGVLRGKEGCKANDCVCSSRGLFQRRYICEDTCAKPSGLLDYLSDISTRELEAGMTEWIMIERWWMTEERVLCTTLG